MKKSAPRPAVKDKHLDTQLRNLRNIFDSAITAVMGEKRALDRFLSSYWRENRQFGSRDRRLFSESIFAFFRFYGWLRTLLTAGEQALIEAGNSRAVAGESAAMLLAGAWILENLPPENAHKLLCSEFNLPPMMEPAVSGNMDPAGVWRQQRFSRFAAEYLKKDVPLPEWKLLQNDWSWEYLQSMDDMQSYFSALAVRPPLWLRVQNDTVENVVKQLMQAGLTVRRHPVMNSALAVIAGSVNLYTLEPYREGKVEVQDLASQVISHACMPQKGERWWDCCAGAGGKTLALAELMQRTGKVVAGDIRSYKLEDLKQRARRGNFPNIETRPWDGNKVPPRRSNKFDGILIDAPCSCSGVWRRNPDGRWNSSPEEVAKVTAIQHTVLENVLTALRPNGVLVYATC
ncbi:MAG: RsmB/NOP family class I SAM-dependent RNA methyltransferase, partial [Lentisphaeria bacterium]|nr:RsmB/NOP family class I SAM-dependent RNA methyltransferase [Lentisphaeria bacterium]